MSFSSIFKSIWGGVQVLEPIAKQIVPNFIPGSAAAFTLIDPLFHAPMNSIVTSEIANPSSGNGAAKLNTAVQAFITQDDITRMQQIASQSGMKLVWDNDSLVKGLSAQADTYNYFQKVSASLKFVPLTPADVPAKQGT